MPMINEPGQKSTVININDEKTEIPMNNEEIRNLYKIN